jgi:hypothetical protein
MVEKEMLLEIIIRKKGIIEKNIYKHLMMMMNDDFV